MEQKNHIADMLALLPGPAFLVRDNAIYHLNDAARRLFLREGIPISTIFDSGFQDYRMFESGALYVTLTFCDQTWGASVTRVEGNDLFVLDQQFESDALRVLALAARELREPLSNAMLAAQQITGENAARLNRGLYQMLRIVSNMSDASAHAALFRPESRDVDAVFQEIVEKAGALTAPLGITLRYEGLKETVLCRMDSQMLERAILNLLSNALKFSESGSVITASVHRTGNLLRFSLTDQGCGLSEDVRGTLFRRYLRDPAIEDSRYGIGLGMLLVRNAAARHGGAVLADQPEGRGTRISFTIRTDLETETTLHTSRLRVDYAGEQDHALLELSELLPPELY